MSTKYCKELKLSDNEKALIIALRTKFCYGEVIIMMRDGIPQRVKKAWVFTELRDIPLDKRK